MSAYEDLTRKRFSGNTDVKKFKTVLCNGSREGRIGGAAIERRT
jgi:hypothetical protein